MRCTPPGPSIRLCVWLVLTVCAGCESKIALGSECPPFGVECLERMPRGDGDANGPDVGGDDPNGDDGGPSDPGDEVDGQVGLPMGGGAIVPSSRFPAFKNGGLEITAGSTDGGLLSYLAVRASPWLSCSTPGFGAGAYSRADLRANMPVGAPAPEDILAPTEGKGLINMPPDGRTLAQTLAEPLMAGERYAFMVDIASTRGTTDIVLEVLGGTGSCFAPELLTMTAPATPGVWSSRCIRFVPTKNYRSIEFSASSPTTATGSRLFVDNIRDDPSCD